MAAPARDVRWGLGDALTATGAGFLASLIAVSVALGVSGEDEIDDLSLWVLALVQVPLWLGLAGVPWLVSRRKGAGSLREDFGFTMRAVDVPVGLLVGFASQLVLTVLAPPFYRFFDVDDDRIGETAQELADQAQDPFGVAVLFLVVVLGAAVFEELCYRGLWQRSIERRWGPAAGVVLSSLVFGAVHFQLYDFPLLVAFGLVLALLAQRSGRLGPAIWAHVAFNLTALVELLG